MNWVVAVLILSISCCWTPLVRRICAALRAARNEGVSTQQATAQALLQFESELSLKQPDNTITSNAYNYAKILAAASIRVQDRREKR